MYIGEQVRECTQVQKLQFVLYQAVSQQIQAKNITLCKYHDHGLEGCFLKEKSCIPGMPSIFYVHVDKMVCSIYLVK